MNKPFALIGREFGRGKPFAKKCNTLVELAAAVKEQWQGADYIDGDNGFHTDYSTTYSLATFRRFGIQNTKSIAGYLDEPLATSDRADSGQGIQGVLRRNPT